MASYQRRGYKKSVKAVESNEEVLDQNSQTAEVFSALDSGASRSEEWFRKNQKIILGLIIAIAVVVRMISDTVNTSPDFCCM